MANDADQWPIALIEDRYSGCYSGGKWIAISESDQIVDAVNTRVQYCLIAENGPSGGDTEAASFWESAPTWIAVAQTPSEAIDLLGSRTNVRAGRSVLPSGGNANIEENLK